MKTLGLLVGPAIAFLVVVIAVSRGVPGPTAFTLVITGYAARMANELIKAAVDGYSNVRRQ